VLVGRASAGDAEYCIAHDLDDIRVDIVDGAALHGGAQQRADVIAEELNVVLDLEPALRLAFEADAQCVAERDGDVIRGLDRAAIADAVVERAQVDRLDSLVGALRRATRQLQHFERLVVLELDRRRARHHAALATRVDDHHGVADPDVHARRTIEARLENQ